MKIICDNQEEYDSLMKTSKYLHDYMVYIDKCSKKTKIEERDINGKCERRKPTKGSRRLYLGLDDDYEQVGYLMHLYLSEDDWPTKKDFITIKEK